MGFIIALFRGLFDHFLFKTDMIKRDHRRHPLIFPPILLIINVNPLTKRKDYVYMLDIKFVRENPEIVKQNIRNKFEDQKLPLVDEVIKFDAE